MKNIFESIKKSLSKKSALEDVAEKIKKGKQLSSSALLYLVTNGIIDEGDLEDVLSYVVSKREYLEKYERRIGKDCLDD